MPRPAARRNRSAEIEALIFSQRLFRRPNQV
jgi:hypothetical protein